MMGETKSDHANSWVITLSVLLILASWSCSPLWAEETVGQQFRRILAQIDKECREYKSGPYLDQADPEYRRKIADTSCDVLKMQPLDWRTEELTTTNGQQYQIPKRWLATPEGRFAHSIKLPASVDPKDVFSPHISGQERFEMLCRKEGGEFVLRTAEDVQGVRQDRPAMVFAAGYIDVAFHAIEQSILIGDHAEEYLVAPKNGRYSFLDIRIPSNDPTKGAGFRRFTKGESSANTVGTKTPTLAAVLGLEVLRVAESDAAYGYTWRGIRRPDDWENGIYGLELIIFQVTPFEVLAVKRIFRRYQPNKDSRDPRSVFVSPCPQIVGKWDVEDKFILSVLQRSR